MVLEKVGSNKHKKVLWRCDCDCGTQTVVTSGDLNSGNSRSCGCLHKEIDSKTHTTHGMCGTPEYRSWYHMKDRCINLKNKNYQDYGGRNINVCEEWLNSFENFFADMGFKPHSGLTLERWDNEKGYSRENCIWTSRVVQGRNQRTPKNNVSGYKGVCWVKRDKKYYSYITANNKRVYLGSYNIIEEAVEARRQGKLKYW